MGRFADALELIALGEKTSAQKINRVSNEREKRQRSISILSLSILLSVLVLGTSLFTYFYFKAVQSTPPPVESLVTVKVTQSPNSPPAQNSIVSATEAPIQATTTPEANSAITLLGTPIITNQSSGFNEIARWGIGGVNVVKWSPDGKTIALGTTSGIFLYDAETKTQILFINTQFNVVEMAFNPSKDKDNHEIAAGSFNGGVNPWDFTSGAVLHSFPYAAPNSAAINDNKRVTAISYSSDGKKLVIGYKNGVINYFPSNQSDPTIIDNSPNVEDLVISPDNRFIYTSNGSNKIDVWEIGTGKKNQTPDTPLSDTTSITNLSITPNAQFLLAGGSGNSVSLWNLASLNRVSSFPNLDGAVTDFDVSNDNKYVAIGLSTGKIQVFAMPVEADYSKTQIPLSTFNDYSEKILSVAFSPNGPIIASGNQEEGLKIRNVESNEKEPFALNQSMRGIEEIYFSSDGAWLATSHADKVVRVWNVNTAEETAYKLDGHGYLPKGVPFSPDNRFLAYVYSPGLNRDESLRVVELTTGNIVAELTGYIQNSFVQFTDDSKLLVMGDSHNAKIWDTATWEEVDTKGESTAGCGQYFTPQSTRLAVISRAGIIFNGDKLDSKINAMCGTKPTGATFMYYYYAQHKMLFVLGNGDLWIWGFSGSDLSRIQSDTPYPLSSKIFLAGDQASGWHAYVANGQINLDNINSSGNNTKIDGQTDYQYRVALLPGKHLMALGSQYGSIHIWTMP